MGDRISKAIVAGLTALSLVATAEPAAAQQRGGSGSQGDWGRPGAMATDAPRGPSVPPGAIAPYSPDASFSDPFWSDCWQVRPIYSISGAWLDNRRVNVCY
ncbi:MAG TPA: hypothetical protein VFE63_19570 [Roseiarcus sp.]|jgi:hypothetical protein|nr:hypothetical protein [Roseiarcus sp.]